MPPLRTLFTRRSLQPDEVIPQVSDDELLAWSDHLRTTPSPSEPLRLQARRPGRPLRAEPLRAEPLPARKLRVRAVQPTAVD
jgi:hypothetical protein